MIILRNIHKKRNPKSFIYAYQTMLFSSCSPFFRFAATRSQENHIFHVYLLKFMTA